jgi:RHS repeat-associated protein
MIYGFNELSNLISYTDSTITGTVTYDSRQLRKVGETVHYGTFSLSYSYDYYANGRKKSFTGPDGVTVNYTYDPNNQLATIQLLAGNITVNSYKWVAPSQITFPGGSVRTQGYDPLLRLTQIQVKNPGQGEVMNYQYDYDSVDSLKTKDTEHGNYSYTYDDLYRLTTAQNPSPLASEAYTYDTLGNRLTDAKTTGTWSYNDNNQLQGLDGITFEYDANGNTTKKIDANDPTQTRNYVYDTADRLIEVRDASNVLIASYSYDPFNRRLAKETTGTNATKTWFFYSDEGLIAEADSSGVVTRTYGYQPDSTWGTNPVYLKQGADTYYYQNDHLGTPQKLIASNGAVVWSATAEAFGTTTVDSASNVTNNLRFPGQYYDEETGLHYNWNRYYDPATGRYTTSDPIGLGGGENLYSYSYANPGYWGDPDGTTSCTAQCILQQIGVAEVVVTTTAVATAPILPKSGGVGGGGPSGRRTSPISKLGQKVQIRLPGRVAGTRNAIRAIGRIGGRLVPGVGGALLIYDIIQIRRCMKECEKTPCDPD